MVAAANKVLKSLAPRGGLTRTPALIRACAVCKEAHRIMTSSATSFRGGAAFVHRRLGEFPFEQAQALSSASGLPHGTQNLEELLLVRQKAPPQARASTRGRRRQRCLKEGAQLLCRRLVVEHGFELPSQLRRGTTRKARREIRLVLPRPHQQGEQETVLRETLFEGAIAGRRAQLVFHGRRQHPPNGAGSHAAAFFTCTEG